MLDSDLISDEHDEIHHVLMGHKSWGGAEIFLSHNRCRNPGRNGVLGKVLCPNTQWPSLPWVMRKRQEACLLRNFQLGKSQDSRNHSAYGPAVPAPQRLPHRVLSKFLNGYAFLLYSVRVGVVQRSAPRLMLNIFYLVALAQGFYVAFYTSNMSFSKE